jgi:hypothetical protein
MTDIVPTGGAQKSVESGHKWPGWVWRWIRENAGVFSLAVTICVAVSQCGISKEQVAIQRQQVEIQASQAAIQASLADADQKLKNLEAQIKEQDVAEKAEKAQLHLALTDRSAIYVDDRSEASSSGNKPRERTYVVLARTELHFESAVVPSVTQVGECTVIATGDPAKEIDDPDYKWRVVKHQFYLRKDIQLSPDEAGVFANGCGEALPQDFGMERDNRVTGLFEKDFAFKSTAPWVHYERYFVFVHPTDPKRLLWHRSANTVPLSSALSLVKGH